MKKVLLYLGLTVITVANSYASLTDSLVACYSFSGNANDGSGNGHNGTVTTATLSADRFTRANSAYNFNGTSGHVFVPADSFLNVNYTYSAWVKLNSIPSFGGSTYVLSVGSTAGDQAISLQNNSNWVGWSAAGYTGTGGVPGATQSVSGVLPSTGAWYHLVASRNNSTLKLYVNGQLAATTNPPAAPYYGSDASKKVVIGERFAFSNTFDGLIDDVRIYKKALDSSEISQIYFSANLLNGLVACYPFTGNANDGSGNGHHGTVTTSTLTADRFVSVNSAYVFDGTSGHVLVPADSFLNANYTYSAWVKANSVPAFGGSTYILSIGSTAGDQAISVQNNSNWVGWSAAGYTGTGGVPGATQSVSGSLPTVGTWYHLVATRNDSTLKLYVNGQIAAITYPPAAPYYGSDPVKKVVIGERFALSNTFDGVIDDARVYKRALTSAEVMVLYLSPAGCSMSSGELTCSGFVSVNENDLEGGFKLYPNPSKGVFDLELGNNESNMKVFIVNSMGQIVYENTIEKFGNKSEKINLSACAKGMYFVVVQTKDKQVAKKIIIE